MIFQTEKNFRNEVIYTQKKSLSFLVHFFNYHQNIIKSSVFRVVDFRGMLVGLKTVKLLNYFNL